MYAIKYKANKGIVVVVVVVVVVVILKLIILDQVMTK